MNKTASPLRAIESTSRFRHCIHSGGLLYLHGVLLVILTTNFAASPAHAQQAAEKSGDKPVTQVLRLLEEMRAEIRQLRQEVQQLNKKVTALQLAQTAQKAEDAIDAEKLEAEIQTGRVALAKADIERRALEAELAALRELGQKQRQNIDQLQSALKQKLEQYTFAGRSFSREQVEADLANRQEHLAATGEKMDGVSELIQQKNAQVQKLRADLEARLLQQKSLPK